MLQLHGIYENGNITLLEDVPIKRRTPVIIDFIIEDEESPDYSALDDMLGFCESNTTDASIKHDDIIYLMRENP